MSLEYKSKYLVDDEKYGIFVKGYACVTILLYMPVGYLGHSLICVEYIKNSEPYVCYYQMYTKSNNYIETISIKDSNNYDKKYDNCKYKTFTGISSDKIIKLHKSVLDDHEKTKKFNDTKDPKYAIKYNILGERTALSIFVTGMNCNDWVRKKLKICGITTYGKSIPSKSICCTFYSVDDF